MFVQWWLETTACKYEVLNYSLKQKYLIIIFKHGIHSILKLVQTSTLHRLTIHNIFYLCSDSKYKIAGLVFKRHRIDVRHVEQLTSWLPLPTTAHQSHGCLLIQVTPAQKLPTWMFRGLTFHTNLGDTIPVPTQAFVYEAEPPRCLAL